MINDQVEPDQGPFVLRFKEVILPVPDLDVRYDLQRQVAQVMVEGVWEDAVDQGGRGPWRATLETKVSRETTDDN